MDHGSRLTPTAVGSAHRLVAGQHSVEDAVENSIDDPDIRGSARHANARHGHDSDEEALDHLSFAPGPLNGSKPAGQGEQRRSSDDGASYEDSSTSTLMAGGREQAFDVVKKLYVYPPVPEVDSPSEQLLRGSSRWRPQLKPMALVDNEAAPIQVSGSQLRQAAALALQSAPSLLLSLFGLVFTGELLDRFSTWSLFVRVDELFILVPILSNLKGNLEMVLGAKLGTAAAKGHLDDPKRRNSIITQALLYLQYQGLAIALLAGIIAFLLGLLHEHKVVSSTGVIVGYTRPGSSELFAVVGTSMATIAIASLALGAFMSLLVVACRHVGVDPDNVASPLAACLGDLLTLCILAIVGSVVVRGINTPWTLAFVAFMLLVSGSVAWMQNRVSKAEKRRRRGGRQNEANAGGWSPLIGAMVISCATGLVLDSYVNVWKGFGLMAIAMTGVAGSIGAIYASRLSTSVQLEDTSPVDSALPSPALSPTVAGDEDQADEGDIYWPFRRHKSLSAYQSALTLFLVAWPVKCIFLLFVGLMGWVDLSLGLVGWILAAYGISVLVSLAAAHWMTLFFHSHDLDPDAYTLPIHSALIDLVGQILLVVAFKLGSTEHPNP